MKKYIVIAWRNLRRNRGRTILTVSAIAFATLFAVLMRSFQIGSYETMINSYVEMYSGFVIVEHPLYADEPALENALVQSETIEKLIMSTENVSGFLPKLNYFSLASYGTQTKGVIISGIDTKKQDEASNLSELLVKYRINDQVLKELQPILADNKFAEAQMLLNESYTNFDFLLKDLEINPKNETELAAKIKQYAHYTGSYLTLDDEGVIIGDRLAKYLHINTGDTLVMLGTGYQAVTAAQKFPVRGIIKIANPTLDASMVYAPLRTTQKYLSAYFTDYETGKEHYLVNSYALNLQNRSDKAITKTKNQLSEKLNPQEYSVKTWKESNKELAQQIDSDEASGQMIMGILYLVIAFGVFGTVLMMTAERKREMGVMIAIGMKKIKLSLMLTFELAFLGLIGVIAGILMSAPFIVLGYYRPIRFKGEMAEMMMQMGFEPVMPMAWFGSYIISQIWVVLIIVALVSIYPMVALKKLKVSDALRA